MSFILDALRRAETQRGHQPRVVTADSALGTIAEKPSATPSLRWIAMSVVAGVAIVIVVIMILSSGDQSQLSPGATKTAGLQQPPPVFPTIAADTPLADAITPTTREVRPLFREARPSANESRPETSPEKPAGRTAPGTVSYSQERLTNDDTRNRTLTNLPANTESLPSYTDAALSGPDQLPVFHLDIHVYAAAPERRFVFVNNRKYREGEQLEEGGTVERITPQGVVLNHRGRRFELVPD